ncbi:Peptidase family M50 [Planctomycetes bacterium CA13]|uniref:Peptidase family M50 n=1 Tax=Novipirellula herctigrandis TaxID=2527986 RepID=A0A5C5YV70_9BACT|nr:Peptidase family M50 [Planctomycetes bacterium CA13]
MTIVPDLTTRDLSGSKIRLACELTFVPQVHGQETYYHIEVPAAGKFFRIGYPEYVFISMLDGTRTVAQALTITARTLGAEALTQSQGLQVATWVIENDIAELADQESVWSPRRQMNNNQRGGLTNRVNPFWMKIPLGSPDQLLAALLPSFGWLLSPVASMVGIIVILFGVGCAATNWTKFIASSAGVLAPNNWLWMLLAWAVLKVVHELAHGLACKYHRGEVRETGVIFILLAPMAYVDVTSCWRFPSKWQRIHVAISGMYAELVLAAVAAITWANVDSSLTHHLLFNVIVMASLSTLLFNANPLMRFDGYYILADLLNVPNLATDANRFVKGTASRLFFGERHRPLQILGFRRWFVCSYGVASTVWRLLVCVSLVSAASVLMHGAGLLLAIIGVFSWFAVPLWKVVVDFQRRFHEKRPSFIRALVCSVSIVVVIGAASLWLPWPGAMDAPVVVDYSDQSVVRSSVNGFVDHVHVMDGEMVEAGQLLVELHNDELEAQLHSLQLEYQQGEVQVRMAIDRHNAAAAQIARRNLQSIEERLNIIRRQSAGLRVHAPVAGRIVARNLHQSTGMYIKEGSEILTVANETRKELVLSVGQEEIDAIKIGDQTRFRIKGRLARVGRMERLDPRASTALPHPAMSSSLGGPLAVTEKEDSDQPSMRLVEPRFRGVITLSAEACQDLGAGEQGYAILGLRQVSIGEFAWVRMHRWYESLLRPSQG